VSKRFRTQRIKTNKMYAVEELADAACVSVPTVRCWLKDGMKRVDDERPTMIMGFQALEYLKGRKDMAKRPMALGQFYCLRCKAPRAPLGGMADYLPQSTTGGRLMALCIVCESSCNRNISATNLGEFAKVLDVEIRGNGQP